MLVLFKSGLPPGKIIECVALYCILCIMYISNSILQVPTELKIQLLSYYWCGINSSEHISTSTLEANHHRHRHSRCPASQLLANLNSIICDLQPNSTCQRIECREQRDHSAIESVHIRAYHNLLLSLGRYIHCEIIAG